MKIQKATVVVDLTPSEDEIMHSIHKDARWGVRKAQKEGLEVRESADESDWSIFYEMYKNTLIEGGNDPKSLEFLKKTSDKLFLCFKDNRVIGGAVIKTSGIENPRLRFNASLKEYQSLQPNNLLYWNCILWCKNKGYKKFDLGGWQINARGHLEGVNKFKEKWGNVVYYEENTGFFKGIGKKLVKNSRFFWWLNQKLKGRRIG